MAEETPRQRLPLDSLLAEVIHRYSEHLPNAPWMNERDRWYELVACVLFAFGGPATGKARCATGVLQTLGLLEVSDLAALAPIGEAIDTADPHISLIHDVLIRLGYTPRDLIGALRTITELARDLAARYEGRIQRYLRGHGARMLADLHSDFPSLSNQDATLHHAFTIWLQNVLTMPIFADTRSTLEFCAEAGCTTAELVEVADRVDINASLLDDVLDLWHIEDQDLRSRRASDEVRQG